MRTGSHRRLQQHTWSRGVLGTVAGVAGAGTAKHGNVSVGGEALPALQCVDGKTLEKVHR